MNTSEALDVVCYWLTLSQHHPCVICERGSVSPDSCWHSRGLDLMQTASDRWRLRQPVDWDDGPPRVFQQLWAEELYVADAHCSLSFRGSYRMVESSDDVWMLLSVKGMTGFSHHSFCDFSRWEDFAFTSGAFELSTVLNTAPWRIKKMTNIVFREHWFWQK